MICFKKRKKEPPDGRLSCCSKSPSSILQYYASMVEKNLKSSLSAIKSATKFMLPLVRCYVYRLLFKASFYGYENKKSDFWSIWLTKSRLIQLHVGFKAETSKILVERSTFGRLGCDGTGMHLVHRWSTSPSPSILVLLPFFLLFFKQSLVCSSISVCPCLCTVIVLKMTTFLDFFSGNLDLVHSNQIALFTRVFWFRFVGLGIVSALWNQLVPCRFPPFSVFPRFGNLVVVWNLLYMARCFAFNLIPAGFREEVAKNLAGKYCCDVGWWLVWLISLGVVLPVKGFYICTLSVASLSCLDLLVSPSFTCSLPDKLYLYDFHGMNSLTALSMFAQSFGLDLQLIDWLWRGSRIGSNTSIRLLIVTNLWKFLNEINLRNILGRLWPFCFPFTRQLFMTRTDEIKGAHHSGYGRSWPRIIPLKRRLVGIRDGEFRGIHLVGSKVGNAFTKSFLNYSRIVYVAFFILEDWSCTYMEFSLFDLAKTNCYQPLHLNCTVWVVGISYEKIISIRKQLTRLIYFEFYGVHTHLSCCGCDRVELLWLSLGSIASKGSLFPVKQ